MNPPWAACLEGAAERLDSIAQTVEATIECGDAVDRKREGGIARREADRCRTVDGPQRLDAAKVDGGLDTGVEPGGRQVIRGVDRCRQRRLPRVGVERGHDALIGKQRREDTAGELA